MDHDHSDRAATARVLLEIAAERDRQIDRHGHDPDKDDRQPLGWWGWLLSRRASDLSCPIDLGDGDTPRRQLVEIAAIATAALESLNRRDAEAAAAVAQLDGTSRPDDPLAEAIGATLEDGEALIVSRDRDGEVLGALKVVNLGDSPEHPDPHPTLPGCSCGYLAQRGEEHRGGCIYGAYPPEVTFKGRRYLNPHGLTVTEDSELVVDELHENLPPVIVASYTPPDTDDQPGRFEAHHYDTYDRPWPAYEHNDTGTKESTDG